MSNTSILVIEDNPITLDTLADILELEGFDILKASNGVEGIHLAQQHLPDLIICDVMMPRADGYTVRAALEASPHTAVIPFVFLTAKADYEDLRRGMHQGTNDYLTKPFVPQDVLKTIETQLRKRAAIAPCHAEDLDNLGPTISPILQVDRDPCTGLANENALQHRLSQVPPLQADQSLYLISIDQLTFLRLILSPEDFHQLQQQLAQRLETWGQGLQTTQAEGSSLDLFHLHSSQFALLLEHPSGSLEVATPNPEPSLNRSILETLSEVLMVADRRLNITASLGIATWSAATAPDLYPLVLLSQATAALDQAQRQGGHQFCHYCPTLTLSMDDRLTLGNALHQALTNQEFHLHYQPQVQLSTGNVTGVEALLRWQSPHMGNVSPERFIPVAEDFGLIGLITQWVIGAACEQAYQWYCTLPEPLVVSINVSALDLHFNNLEQVIFGHLQRLGLPPHLLQIEVTETGLVADGLQALDTLTRLREQGIRVAIDDFGTGYSSLSYLSLFPWDSLKIDRVFIQNIHQNVNNQSIVALVIQLAQALNLKVVAEGVEVAEEADCLRNFGCDWIQGYFYGRQIGRAHV